MCCHLQRVLLGPGTPDRVRRPGCIWLELHARERKAKLAKERPQALGPEPTRARDREASTASEAGSCLLHLSSAAGFRGVVVRLGIQIMASLPLGGRLPRTRADRLLQAALCAGCLSWFAGPVAPERGGCSVEYHGQLLPPTLPCCLCCSLFCTPAAGAAPCFSSCSVRAAARDCEWPGPVARSGQSQIDPEPSISFRDTQARGKLACLAAARRQPKFAFVLEDKPSMLIPSIPTQWLGMRLARLSTMPVAAPQGRRRVLMQRDHSARADFASLRPRVVRSRPSYVRCGVRVPGFI